LIIFEHLEGSMHLFFYLLLTAVIVILEHFTFGRWWANNEIARRTMGHATILGLAFLFIPSGLIDLTTLITIFLATGVAGAITAGTVVTEKEFKKKKQAEIHRREVERYD
jgi:hypothetical protein